jgi:hypothetical protein
MPIANVALTNTFDEWRVRTNQVIVLSNEVNALAVAASVVANAGFDKANSANIVGSSAFNVANTVKLIANTAFDKANAVQLIANTAFDKANLANIVGSSAFDKANSANIVGSSAFNAANTVQLIANTAFDKANSANIIGSSAFNTANAGYNAANTAQTTAVAAFTKANTSGGGGTTITIAEDSVNATRYVAFVNAATGNASTINVSSAALTFNPSTGTLSATTFNSLSDYKLKTNIIHISGALETIKSLNGVSFEWKNNGIRSYGVIAQDIEKHIPDLVGNIDGTKNVNYDGIIAFLIEAIKELNAKLDAK